MNNRDYTTAMKWKKALVKYTIDEIHSAKTDFEFIIIHIYIYISVLLLSYLYVVALLSFCDDAITFAAIVASNFWWSAGGDIPVGMHGKDDGACVADGIISVRGLVTGIRDWKPSDKRGTSGGNGKDGAGLIGANRSGETPGVPRNAEGKNGGPGGKNGAPG